MMKNQFSDVNGLQDLVLGQKLHSNVYRSIPFVQVLHDGKLHWIAVSLYGCAQGEIFLMDSLLGSSSSGIKAETSRPSKKVAYDPWDCLVLIDIVY